MIPGKTASIKLNETAAARWSISSVIIFFQRMLKTK
ncbi:MAG: hypothetical protein ACJA1O_003600 [Spirosomataceae bacterium]|jgi:hypothetical protein